MLIAGIPPLAATAALAVLWIEASSVHATVCISISIAAITNTTSNSNLQVLVCARNRTKGNGSAGTIASYSSDRLIRARKDHGVASLCAST